MRNLTLLTDIHLIQETPAYVVVFICKERFFVAAKVTALIYRQVSECTACKSLLILKSAVAFSHSSVILGFSETSLSALRLVQSLLWRWFSIKLRSNVYQTDFSRSTISSLFSNSFKHTTKVFDQFWYKVGSYTNVVYILRALICFHYKVQVFPNYASKSWQSPIQPLSWTLEAYVLEPILKVSRCNDCSTDNCMHRHFLRTV